MWGLVSSVLRNRWMYFAPLAAMLYGCTDPTVLVLHSPMQPTSTQAVTYSASAYDIEGVQTIEIWEDRNQLAICPGGVPCATPVSTTQIADCNYPFLRFKATCEFVTPSGYPDASLIGYRAVVTDSFGRSASDGWIYYAAGAYPWPNEAIPIYTSADTANAVDLVFIPDLDYGGDTAGFMQDASDQVANTYFSDRPFSRQIRGNRQYWNFYITYEPGDAQGYPAGCNTAPANWLTLRAVVNSGGILHRDSLRDCSGVGDGSIFSVEGPSATPNGTTIHETGHSVFSLADEYCCDGGYFETLIEPNVFMSEANCQANAAAHGWDPSDCTAIGTTGAWRSDGDRDIMVSSGTFSRFRRSGRASIEWHYSQCDAGNC